MIPAWVGTVYTQIVGPLTVEQAAFVSAVIVQNIPRCESCKHWDKDVSEKDRGRCTMVYGSDDTKMWPDLYDGINTTADFGCVQWEAKP